MRTGTVEPRQRILTKALAFLATLKDDLASLKIDSDSRAGGRRGGVWLIVGLVLLAVIGGLGWFWTQTLQATAVKTAAVTARATGPGAAAGSVLNASGYVTARRRATVSSKVTGKVLEVFVEEGKAIRKGQVLARLDDSQIRAALAVAEAQLVAAQRGAAEDEARLKQAELTLDRRSRLMQEKVVGRAEVDDAQGDVDSLKARIAVAHQQVQVSETMVRARQTDLTDMVVRAPFDGIAISKDAQPGEMISPVSAGGGFTRTGICTIVDMSSLEIEVDVSETYINRVHRRPAGRGGARRLPRLADPGARDHDDPVGGSAEGDRQGADRIRSSSTRGSCPTWASRSRSCRTSEPADRGAGAAPRMVVPKAAVRTVDGQHRRVRRRRTTASSAARSASGTENGGQVEVLSGVSAGERVVARRARRR